MISRLENLRKDFIKIKDDLYYQEETEVSKILIELVNNLLDVVQTNRMILDENQNNW